MHRTEPQDYSALSYGAGLAIGLLLILGLPAADESRTVLAADGAPILAQSGMR